MNCQTKEMMRLEFLLSLGFSRVQESQVFNRMNQRSLSQCSGLRITTFKIGTPGEKPHPNKNSLNSKKNVFMKSELPWGSDILVPVFPLWVMMWFFPKKSVFWFSVKSIPLTALTPPYNWYVMLMLSSISATWTSVKQIQVIGLQLVASTRQFAVWRDSSCCENCLSPCLEQAFLLPCFV